MPVERVRVSIYINEADEWRHRPLHLEILRLFKEEGLAGGTVLRGVAGYTRGGGVQSTSLVDAGGRLPLVVEFIDTAEAAERIMPALRQMVGDRLIVREKVIIEGPPAY
jgi:PII-like signaling protein